MEASAPAIDEVGGRFATAGETVNLGAHGTLKLHLSWYNDAHASASLMSKSRGGALCTTSKSFVPSPSTSATQLKEASKTSTTTADDWMLVSGVDLDLGAVCFDYNGNALEAVFFNKVRSMDGGITLNSGDQSKGTIGEELTTLLQKVSPKVQLVAITIMCSTSSVFLGEVEGVAIVAHATGTTAGADDCDQVVFNADFRKCKKERPMVLMPCYLDRRDTKQNAWKLQFGDHFLPGQTFVDAVPSMRRALLLPPDAKTEFKIPVQLDKDEALLINTDDGITSVGCGWDIVNDEETDVDLSCMLLAKTGTIVDYCYWGKLSACHGIVEHLGDNLTGEGDGDDEMVVMNLADLPLDVHHVVFVVSNYSAGNLEKLKNIHFRVFRDIDNAELLRFESIGAGGNYSSFLACAIDRGMTNDQWRVRKLSIPCQGQTVIDESVKSTMLKVVAEKQQIIKPVNLRAAIRRGAEKMDARGVGKNGNCGNASSSSGAGGSAPTAALQQPQQATSPWTIGNIFMFIVAVLLAYIITHSD